MGRRNGPPCAPCLPDLTALAQALDHRLRPASGWFLPLGARAGAAQFRGIEVS